MEERYSPDIVERAKKIKLLVLDVDGVLSDGRLIYANRGDELKSFDVNDGLGIYLMKQAGIGVIFLTAKASRIVKRRARELKVDKVYQNFHDKGGAFEDIKVKFGINSESICFIGDDIIDVPVLKKVGLAVAPSNAMDEVKAFVHVVTEKRGGRGAVREVCNFILKSQGVWDKVTDRFLK